LEAMIYTDRQQLIMEHLPLVNKVVNRIRISKLEFERDDLVNTGIIGLMDAIDKFDEKHGVPFEHYAGIRIRGSILDALRKNGSLSKERIASLKKFNEHKSLLEQQYQRHLSDFELCNYMEISVQQLGVLYQTMAVLPIMSLDELLFSEDSDFSLLDKISSQDSPLPEETILKEALSDALSKAIFKLSDRDQLILQLYYVEELTFKEIALILDVSVPRVSQLHMRAIAELRNVLEAWR